MSSAATSNKRARRSPLLNPLLPYLAPELWSKVLETLPYGKIHELISTDDRNLVILSKAARHIGTLNVTCPDDLALIPRQDLLSGVKILTAVCWDDKEEDYILSLPGNPSAVPYTKLPIDDSLGENIGKLVELVSRLPSIENVHAEGFGGTGLPIMSRRNSGPRDSKTRPKPLCEKLEALCDLARHHGDNTNKYSLCVKGFINALCEGYSSGKLPQNTLLTRNNWCKDAAVLCCVAGAENDATNPCSCCDKLSKSLPFSSLLSIANSDGSGDLCMSKDSILSAICERPGGLDFMSDPSHIEGIIRDIEYNHYPFSVDIACTKGGSPIVPAQNGSKKDGKWTFAIPPKPESYCAHAFFIPQSKLDIMVDLKKKYGSTVNSEFFVEIFYKSLKESIRHLGSYGSFAIDTLCDKPFIMQNTVDTLRTGLGVTLPADKFVVFPDVAEIREGFPRVDFPYPEGYWSYTDWKGDPPESEDEGDY